MDEMPCTLTDPAAANLSFGTGISALSAVVRIRTDFHAAARAACQRTLAVVRRTNTSPFVRGQLGANLVFPARFAAGTAVLIRIDDALAEAAEAFGRTIIRGSRILAFLHRAR